MELRKLQRVVIDALEDVKAQDIRVYDTTKLSELFDRVIIATGSSNRQTRSLAMSVKEEVNAKGGEVISVEGLETGEWVLVDCGDIVVHILQPRWAPKSRNYSTSVKLLIQLALKINHLASSILMKLSQ